MAEALNDEAVLPILSSLEALVQELSKVNNQLDEMEAHFTLCDITNCMGVEPAADVRGNNDESIDVNDDTNPNQMLYTTEDDDESFDYMFDIFTDVDDIPKQVLPFDPGVEAFGLCEICFDRKTIYLRNCCRLGTCDTCIETYLKMCVDENRLVIPCPNDKCDEQVFSDEILARLSFASKMKYYQFLVDANNNPFEKTCPRCSYITKVVENVRTKSKKLSKIVCVKCHLIWCFECHAPWHNGMSCKSYRKGNKMIKSWSKQHFGGQKNARRCPKCKVYIQRIEGCNSMVCNRCVTNFCYSCGKRYLKLKLLGGHNSRLSILGCKHNFLPRLPLLRRLIRGTVLSAGVIFFLSGVPLVSAGLLFALPFVAVEKLRRTIRERRRNYITRLAEQIRQETELLYNTLPRPYNVRARDSLSDIHNPRRPYCRRPNTEDEQQAFIPADNAQGSLEVSSASTFMSDSDTDSMPSLSKERFTKPSNEAQVEDQTKTENSVGVGFIDCDDCTSDGACDNCSEIERRLFLKYQRLCQNNLDSSFDSTYVGKIHKTLCTAQVKNYNVNPPRRQPNLNNKFQEGEKGSDATVITTNPDSSISSSILVSRKSIENTEPVVTLVEVKETPRNVDTLEYVEVFVKSYNQTAKPIAPETKLHCDAHLNTSK